MNDMNQKTNATPALTIYHLTQTIICDTFRYGMMALFTIYTYNLEAQGDTTKLYLFGHSLLDHRPPLYPTPSDETTVPHWLHFLAESAGDDFAATGQYGFLPSHASNLPPIANWGYQHVAPAWDSDTDEFGVADFTHVFLTAANFIQETPVQDPHPIDASTTVLDATTEILDWVQTAEPGVRFYIYENWPEMSAFPLSTTEISNYHAQTQGIFNDWWITFQDSMILRRPDLQVKMIPVGPIISKLLTQPVFDAIPQDSLYEDNAPHGRPTLYFLASMVCYSAIFEAEIPANYQPPDLIHSAIRNNLSEVRNFIWNELQMFNDKNNESRVFHRTSTADIMLADDCITLHPNPTPGTLTINGILSHYTLDILDANGLVHQNLDTSDPTITVDLSTLPSGLYFIRLINNTNQNLSLQKIIKHD